MLIGEWILSGTIVVIGTFTISWIISRIERSREKRKAQEDEFTEVLLKGIVNETIQDLDDIVGIYKAVREIGTGSTFFLPGVGPR